jgi:hypothetical protein
MDSADRVPQTEAIVVRPGRIVAPAYRLTPDREQLLAELQKGELENEDNPSRLAAVVDLLYFLQEERARLKREAPTTKESKDFHSAARTIISTLEFAQRHFGDTKVAELRRTAVYLGILGVTDREKRAAHRPSPIALRQAIEFLAKNYQERSSRRPTVLKARTSGEYEGDFLQFVDSVLDLVPDPQRRKIPARGIARGKAAERVLTTLRQRTG